MWKFLQTFIEDKFYLVGLAGFHSYLAASELTTNEDIKGTFTAKRGQDNFNPFSKGSILKNCLGVLCGPNVPSLIDRRAIVVPEPQQPVLHTTNTGTSTAPDNRTTVSVPEEAVYPPSEGGMKKRDMISYQSPDGSITNKLPPLNGNGKKNHIWDVTFNQLDYLGHRVNIYPASHGGVSYYKDSGPGGGPHDPHAAPAAAFKDNHNARYVASRGVSTTDFQNAAY
ncbi:hypothetical protein RRG08_038958 [Elysia crispata]|uniref:Uncharacterized protein n=1 Tax=Elysia crispata TaxID=231223 RepID=A0AAE1CTH6_9GAST|nr:hypothetical protein RRG08_038958 [Elysia crispata]